MSYQDTPLSTPSTDTVDTLRAQLPATINTSTLYALATLVDWRSATLDTLHPSVRATIHMGEPGVVQVVWIVTADSYAIGGSDLDNTVSVTGVYGSLEVAVANVWRKIIADERIYNPIFTETVVQTALTPIPHYPGPDSPLGNAADLRDGDAGSQLGTEDHGPW